MECVLGALQGHVLTQSDDIEALHHGALMLWHETTWQPDDCATLKPTTSSKRDQIVRQLLELDATNWNRVARLLFSADQAIVQTVIGVIENLSRLELGNCHLPSDNTRSQLFTRVIESSWHQLIMTKVADLCALQVHQDQEELSSELLGALKLVAALVRIWCHYQSLVGIPSTTTTTTNNNNNNNIEPPPLVELLLFMWQHFQSNRQRKHLNLQVDLCLTQQLALMLQHLQGSCGSTVTSPRLVQGQFIARGLLVQLVDQVDVAPLSWSWMSMSKHQKKNQEQQWRQELLLTQLELLELMVRGNEQASLSIIGGDPQPLVDKWQKLIRAPSSAIQSRTLEWLNAVLESIADNKVQMMRLTLELRVAGFLMDLSWLFGHHQPQIEAIAGRSMGLLVKHSPKVDLLRSLVEQGCVFIYEWLAHHQVVVTQPRMPEQHQPVPSRARRMLEWMLQELDIKLFVVFLRGTLASTNNLLRKNVLWGLLLLHRRARLQNLAHARSESKSQHQHEHQEHEQEQEQELRQILQQLLDTDEQSALAVSLLQLCVLCCDKCSTIKLTAVTTANRPVPPPLPGFELHRSKSFSSHAKPSPSAAPSPFSCVRLVFCCQGGDTLWVTETSTLSLVLRNCKLFSTTRKSTSSRVCSPSQVGVAELDDGSVQIRLANVAKKTLELMLELLAMHQSSKDDAVLRTFDEEREESMAVFLTRLDALLELSQLLDCAVLWHCVTKSLSQRLDATTWLAILELAVRRRHPSLMLRAVRVAMDDYQNHQLQVAVTNSAAAGAVPSTLPNQHMTRKHQLGRATVLLIDELFFG